MHNQPVALVTGGSRGIGRGICVELAKQGYAVAINYAGNLEAARQTQQAIGSAAETLLCRADIGVSAEREQLVGAVLARWDRIDLLVNNAGITSVGRRDLLEATEDSWERVLAVNLKGPFFLTQRVAQTMLERLPRLQRPTIVNISQLFRLRLIHESGRLLYLEGGAGHGDAVVRGPAGGTRHPRV